MFLMSRSNNNSDGILASKNERNESRNAKTRLEAGPNSIAYFEAQTKRQTDGDAEKMS